MSSNEEPSRARKVRELPLFDARLLAALGVLSAGLLLSEVNILGARSYRRFDVSEEQAYSLSEVSQKIARELDSPVRITVLLPAGDSRLTEARHLLESYRAYTSQLELKFLDPDRDTAEFLALGQKLSLGDDELSKNGLTDASFLIESGSRNWFIPSSQLRSIDDEGHERSRMEAALSEGISRVLENDEIRLCFVSGHGERSLDDAAPEGLLELSRQLIKNNLNLERVALDVPEPDQALRECDALAVVGPSRSFPREHEDAMLDAWNRGASLLLFLDPLVSSDAQIVPSGLARLTAAVGVVAENSFVLERDPGLRLPEGLGESFFALAKTHPITRNLSTNEARLDARLLMVAAQPLRPASGSSAVPLLETSKEATAITDLGRPETKTVTTGDPAQAATSAPFSLAFALDESNALPKRKAVVVGSSNALWNSSFRDSILHGNRVFAESAFAWTLARKGLLSVPERARMSAGLSLSEDSLAALLRYVLVYMPFTAAGAGALVLLQRRRREEQSREKRRTS